jgi:hypothetical protein
MQLAGYFNRRTEQILCLKDGQQDIESPRRPWAALRLVGRLQARYASTSAVICHECGASLNDASTGYTILSSNTNYWKRGHVPGRGDQ